MTYLDELIATICAESTYALSQLDGGPEGGYGPRIWLPYWRKKAIAKSLSRIASEVEMFQRTAMPHEVRLTTGRSLSA